MGPSNEKGPGDGAQRGPSPGAKWSAWEPDASIGIENVVAVGPDQTGVIAADRDGGRAGPRAGAARTVARVARPVAQVLGRVRDVGLGDGLARVLDVDEQRASVRRLGDAGDLAVLGADQETAQVAGGRLGADPRRHGGRGAIR